MTGTQWNYDFGGYLVSDWNVVLDETVEVIENNVLKIRRTVNLHQLHLYQTSPGFSFTNGFILCHSTKLAQGTERPSTSGYVKVGGEWHQVATYSTLLDDNFQPMRDLEKPARPVAMGGSSVGSPVFAGTVWKWVGLRFNQDTTIDVIYSLSTNHKIIPLANEWTVAASAQGNWTGGTVQEVGMLDYLGAFNGQLNEKFRYISKLALISLDYDGQLAPIGIDQTVIDVISDYYFRNALNGGGNAKFTISNPFEEISSATLIAQLKKELIFNNRYENVAFRGEVGSVQLSINEAEYEVEEVSRKTMFTRVTSNPVVFSTFLRYWEGRNVIDKDAFWEDNGVLDSHIITFEKSDKKTFSTRPIASTQTITDDDFSTPYVPNNILGNASRLYYPFDLFFGTSSRKDSDQGLVIVDVQLQSNIKEWTIQFDNHIFEKFENSIKKAEFYYEIAFISKNIWTNTDSDGKPKILIYDYVRTEWVKIHAVEKKDIDGSKVAVEASIGGNPQYRGKPVPYTINIEKEVIEERNLDDDGDLWDQGETYAEDDQVVYNDRLYSSLQNANTNKTPTDEVDWWRLGIYDFLDVISSASTNDEFNKYEFKFALQVAVHTLASTSSEEANGFWLFEAKTSFSFENDNEPEFHSSSINTVNQTTINSAAISGINLPEEDGFGADDIVTISKSAKDYIEEAWAASPIDALAELDFQVTGADDFGLTDDYTYKTFFQLLQDISSMLNATWWYDYPTATIVVRSVDLLEDSGVIIQAEKVVNWDLGQWSIDYDATKERSSAIVIGDDVVASRDFTPDHNFDLGDEVEIIDDSSIHTATQAKNLLASLKPMMESPGTTVRFTLDYSDTDNNYAAIQRGKLITIQFPTTGSPTIADFSGSAKLLVISMEHNVNTETGYNEHVTITAQKRES